MNHTAISPVPSRCHTRSGFPSALKSPIVTIFQVVSAELGVNSEPDTKLTPFISHTPIWPVVSCCQTKSVLPSIPKSPVPTTFQPGSGGCVGNTELPTNDAPSINQVAI